MKSGQDNINAFEGLSAELLAADTGDREAITQILINLSGAAALLEPGSGAEKLAIAAQQVLREIANNGVADPAASLTHLAEAMMTIAKYLQRGDGQSAASVEAAIDSMQQIQNKASRSSPSAQQSAGSPDASGADYSASSGGPDSGALAGDQELLGDFVAEAMDHVAAGESSLLLLEENPEDTEQVNTILRAFHTIKGASAFLGLDQIQHLAHSAENLLARARDGEIRVVGQAADLVFKCCDLLKRMIGNLQKTEGDSTWKAPDDLDELLEQLSDFQDVDQAQSVPVDDTPSEDQILEGIQEKQEVGQSDRLSGQQIHNSTVRIGTKRLDDLIDMVGELVIAQSMISQSPEMSQNRTREFIRSVAHTGKIVRKLQDLAMSLRMVPLKSIFAKMNRLTRDLSHKSGKRVKFVSSGEATEIDRNMVETLTDPLVHMIRNAVDHGIETEEQRIKQGKDPVGTVYLRAYHSSGNVVIEVQDDGRGLDRQRIVNKAVEHGLLRTSSDFTDEQICSLIFHPGLSTAETVTEVSGRGVGMDVVRRNITRLRGRVEVLAEPGQGTTFRLCLPLTMAITDAMLVRVGAERFLMPTISMERSFRPEPGSISHIAEDGEMVMFRGELLPIFRLHKLFGINDAVTDPYSALLVAVSGSGRRCALMVDELLGHQQAVIKSLGKAFEGIQGAAGGAILGDSRVAIILDADSLVNLAMSENQGYSVAAASA